MSKVFLFASLSLFMAIGLILTGCSNEQPSQPPSESSEDSPGQPAATGDEDHGDHEGHENHAGNAGNAGNSEYEEELSQLSAEDRAMAEKQKVCPVSDHQLGSMGKPYRTAINGQDLILCCPGCEDKLKENPEEYLAKLPK